MSNMRFKEWIWPRIPENYTQVSLREPVYTKDEENNVVFAGMGPVKVTVSGNGVFFGASAYEDYKAMARLFADGTAGELYHPLWGAQQVIFTQLQMTQEPKTNYVAYRFEFRGVDEKGAIPQ